MNNKQGNLASGQLKILNDSTEKGIQFIQHFNESVTRYEPQKQFLLPVSHNLMYHLSYVL